MTDAKLPAALEIARLHDQLAKTEALAERLAEVGRAAVRIGACTDKQLVEWVDALTAWQVRNG